MRLPKHREIISFVFTCLCITFKLTLNSSVFHLPDHDECWSMPSIDTLLILDQHSIDTSVDTQLTLHQHLERQSFENWLILDRYMWVSQHLANYQPTVDQVLIKCQLRCRSSVDQVLTRYRLGCWSSVDWDVDCGSIKGIYRHSTTDAFSTHDPSHLLLEPNSFFNN